MPLKKPAANASKRNGTALGKRTDEPTALYQQVKDHVDKKISSGEWGNGDRVSSEAELVSARAYQHNSFKIELAKRAIVRALSTVAAMT